MNAFVKVFAVAPYHDGRANFAAGQIRERNW